MDDYILIPNSAVLTALFVDKDSKTVLSELFLYAAANLSLKTQFLTLPAATCCLLDFR
jgi:hypothetical protein